MLKDSGKSAYCVLWRQECVSSKRGQCKRYFIDSDINSTAQKVSRSAWKVSCRVKHEHQLVSTPSHDLLPPPSRGQHNLPRVYLSSGRTYLQCNMNISC